MAIRDLEVLNSETMGINREPRWGVSLSHSKLMQISKLERTFFFFRRKKIYSFHSILKGTSDSRRLRIIWTCIKGAQPALFAIVTPFAQQACDPVKHDHHFTFLSFCPQDWKLREARTELTAPYSHRHKITLEPTAASVTATHQPRGQITALPNPFLIQL